MSVGLLMVLSGCGDDGAAVTPDASTPTDAAVDAGGGDASFVPAPPAQPAPVDATPCPVGWRERPLEGAAVVCEPYAGEDPSECGPYEAHFPGGEGCEVIGAACPGGQFPDVPTTAVAIYVAEGATGGDGTIGAPFGTVREAAVIARSGAVIVVGKGSYTEEITLRGGVELRGACAAETVITSASAVGLAGVITVTSAEVVLRDLRIEGAARAGLLVDGGSVRAEGVIFDDNSAAGVRITDGGQLVMENCVVRGTRPSATDPFSGSGIDADRRGTVAASRVVIQGNHADGVAARFDAVVDLSDVVISASGGRGIIAARGARITGVRVYLHGNGSVAVLGELEARVELTHVVVRDTSGRGLMARDGGAVLATKGLIERSEEIAVRSQGEGSELTLEDTAVLATRAGSAPVGRGLDVGSGASATVRRLLVSQAIESGISVGGGSLHAEDLTVVETLARPSDLTHGRALMMQGAAQVQLTRARFESSREAAVIAIQDGTLLVAEDLTITNTLPRESDDRFGRALVVEYGAHAEIRRALLEDSFDAAVYVNELGASLTLEDTVIRDVASERSSGGRGRGAEVLRGAAVSMTRVEISHSRELGILVSNGSSLEFEDLRVLDTAPSEWDGAAGRGVTIQVASTATGRGLTVERCFEVGVVVAGDATLDASDVVIRDVARVVCTRDGPCQAGFGMGLGVYVDSVAAVSDFQIEGAATCGVQVDASGLDLTRGVVSSCVIGACVDSPGFDLVRLQNDVQYVDNETNVDATRLPVPAIIGSTE